MPPEIEIESVVDVGYVITEIFTLPRNPMHATRPEKRRQKTGCAASKGEPNVMIECLPNKTQSPPSHFQSSRDDLFGTRQRQVVSDGA